MNNLKTYEFGADTGTLKNAHESGLLPEHWEAVFRTMVSEIVSMVRQRPRSVYLCSTDQDVDARNHLGFVLARLLGEHIPGTLVVDCDFLSVGMSGIVPHRDGLGFLDLLLYGTSLGVITQQTAHGATVVGAGSFAVTKQSPFATDAFVNSRRYLVNQAKCVLFVGPVADDDGNLHPIAANVDLVALVRLGDRFDPRISDPFEEKIASVGEVEAWSVRLNTRMAHPAARDARQPLREEPTLVAQVEELVERSADGEPGEPSRGRIETVTEPAAGSPPPTADPERMAEREPFFDEEEPPGPRFGRGKISGSRAGRVIISLVAVAAVVFVVWWLYLTRSVREQGGPAVERARPTTATVKPPVPDSSRAGAQEGGPGSGIPEVTPATGAASEATVRGGDAVTPERRVETAAPERRESAVQTPRIVSSTPDSVFFVQSLDRFADQYVIHVSSFRGTDKAREEVLFLAGRGYPVFIYHVDLGSKGMWYRVYVGPYATRDDAMESKIKLDEIPRITSTRVSKVPG